MKTYLYLGAIVLVLFAVCCSDNDGSDLPESPLPDNQENVIQVETSIVPIIETSGGSEKITFTAKGNWQASVVEARSALDWISVKPTSGIAGKHELTVTTTENTDYTERNAGIKLSSGTESQILTFTQKQKDAILLTSNKIEISATGGEVNIQFQTNVNYDYQIECPKGWLHDGSKGTRGLENRTLTLTAEENDATISRSATVHITGAGLKETVSVYQLPSVPVLVLTDSLFTVPAAGDTIQIEVKSNSDYIVELPDVDWLTEDGGRSLSSYTHRFIIEPNETGENRETRIGFKNKETDIVEYVTIQQLDATAIILLQDTLTLDYKEQYIDVLYQTNTDIEYYITESSKGWVSVVENRAMREETIRLKIESNDENIESRSCDLIILHATDHVADTLHICQKGLMYGYYSSAETGMQMEWDNALVIENGDYVKAIIDSIGYSHVSVGNLWNEDGSILNAIFDDQHRMVAAFSNGVSCYFHNHEGNKVDMIIFEDGTVHETKEIDLPSELTGNYSRTVHEGVSQNYYMKTLGWILFTKKAARATAKNFMDGMSLVLEKVAAEMAEEDSPLPPEWELIYDLLKEAENVEGKVDAYLSYFEKMEELYNEMKLWLYQHYAGNCQIHTLDAIQVDADSYKIGYQLQFTSSIPPVFRENTFFGLILEKTYETRQGLNAYGDVEFRIIGNNPSDESRWTLIDDIEVGVVCHYRAFVITAGEATNFNFAENAAQVMAGNPNDSYIYYGELKNVNPADGKITQIEYPTPAYCEDDVVHFPIKVHAEHYILDIKDNPLVNWGIAVYRDFERYTQHIIGGADRNDPNITQSDFGTNCEIARMGTITTEIQIPVKEMKVRADEPYVAGPSIPWSLGVYRHWHVANHGGDTEYYVDRYNLDLIYNRTPTSFAGDATDITSESASIVATYSDFKIWGGVCGIEYKNNHETIRKNFEVPDGTAYKITLNKLTPNTVYHYKTYIQVGNDMFFSEETKSFTTSDAEDNKSNEANLRERLMQLYVDTGGDDWDENENWLSDAPLTEWYGISVDEWTEKLVIDLTNNNLTGYINLAAKTDADKNAFDGVYSIILEDNRISGVDISGTGGISHINCNGNPIGQFIAKNCPDLYLVHLDHTGKKLPVTSDLTIDVSGCAKLQSLICRKSNAISIDLTGCTSLSTLEASDNKLTCLDLSDCTALYEVYLRGNALTSLDLSGKTELWQLDANGNALKNLDVTGCTSLSFLSANDNNLPAVTLSGLDALKTVQLNDNMLSDIVLENCPIIMEILMDNNRLESVDISNIPTLEHLFCRENEIHTINITGCTNLKSIYADKNRLTGLDFTQCPGLEVLRISNNGFTTLDVSNLADLRIIYCHYNDMTDIRLDGCLALESLHCVGNELTDMPVEHCTKLKELECGDNKILKVITEFYQKLGYFLYDKRYYYWKQDDGSIKIEDTERGWWYEGEPDKMEHKP